MTEFKRQWMECDESTVVAVSQYKNIVYQDLITLRNEASRWSIARDLTHMEHEVITRKLLRLENGEEFLVQEIPEIWIYRGPDGLTMESIAGRGRTGFVIYNYSQRENLGDAKVEKVQFYHVQAQRVSPN